MDDVQHDERRSSTKEETAREVDLVHLKAPVPGERARKPRNADGVRLRRFEYGDVVAAHALSRTLKWPHRIEDWQLALSLGQGVVAEQEGQVLGTAMCWNWGAKCSTLGLVMVAPALQGLRIGNRMMEALLDRLPGRDVLLHATAEGRRLYERLGFVAAGEVVQHQGVLLAPVTLAAPESEQLRPFEDADLEPLIALDAQGAGMPRGELLRRLFADERTLVLERDGHIAGFAVLRRFGRGQGVGPVAAPDIEAARLLIAACAQLAKGFLRLDVNAAGGLAPWLESLGLASAGRATVMVRGRVPQRGELHGGWALVTQAIG